MLSDSKVITVIITLAHAPCHARGAIHTIHMLLRPNSISLRQLSHRALRRPSPLAAASGRRRPTPCGAGRRRPRRRSSRSRSASAAAAVPASPRSVPHADAGSFANGCYYVYSCTTIRSKNVRYWFCAFKIAGIIVVVVETPFPFRHEWPCGTKGRFGRARSQ